MVETSAHETDLLSANPSSESERPDTQQRTRAPYMTMAYWLRFTIVAIAYFGAARLGLLLAFEHGNVTPVWPPSGIAVAALIVLGMRFWPALFVAAFATEISAGVGPWVGLGQAAGNTLEYTLAAVLLQRFDFDSGFRRIRDVVTLGVVGTLSPIVAATIGTACLWAGGVIPGAAVRTIWPVYLVGDGVGILVLTPVLLVWLRRGRRVGVYPWPRALEAASLGSAAAILAGLVFLRAGGGAYPLFPLVIWAALRFGQRGATLTVLLISALAVFGTVHGMGPFAHGPVTGRLADLLVYLAALGITAPILAAAVLAHRDSEERVLHYVAELEVSNRELEAFAYSVAHDLRAPLRAIDGYSAAMNEDFAESLPPEAQRNLNRIASNAQQLGRLIDALLNFSRLGAKKLVREHVFPKQIAYQVFERLRAGARNPDLEISISELPPCSADPTLLSLVYQNLLENALKFTSDREDVKIEVGYLAASGAAGATVYYVRDNGAGFDMQYSDKLFGVFSRLHSQAQFPGTGAGLAITKRIVTKHGGRIWAEATPGVGATFFFTLDSGF
jgi:signal transduction histidine kinase